MKTRLRILNLVLIIACGFAVWQMRANHVDANARMDRMFSPSKGDAKTKEVAIEPLPPAPKAADYSEVAMRMVFSQDRRTEDEATTLAGGADRARGGNAVARFAPGLGSRELNQRVPLRRE